MPSIMKVNMTTKEIASSENPDYRLLGGRALSARILLDEVPPNCEPLGEKNKLVIAPGLLAGTPVTSGSRVSCGAKSPLTNGVKEANCGGNIGLFLGRFGIKAIVIEGQPKDDHSYVLKIGKDGASLLTMDELKLLGTYETDKRLRAKFGKDVGVLCIGPAGENQLRMACIASSDPNGELKFAARGGLGAVMGSKKLKAIVADKTMEQMPYHDRQAFMDMVREIHAEFINNPSIKSVNQRYGTASIVKAVNAMGAFPTRNFREGSIEGVDNLSGEKMYETIVSRGGEGKTGVSCMNGCLIKCSNIYPDASGKKICSTMQYENIALLGPNLGFTDLDAVARLNYECDDIGIDAIEAGAALGVALDMGMGKWGDLDRCLELMGEIRNNTLMGKILGHGTQVTGDVLGSKRIPTAKGQSFAGYDPRGLKGNGVTYAMCTMGGDHTAGNCFGSRNEVPPLGRDRQGDLSRDTQFRICALDSLGFCIFARPPLLKVPTRMTTLVNALLGTEITPDQLWEIMGLNAIRTEREFNVKAGLSPASDKLPEFLYVEPLAPTNEVFDLSEEEMLKAVI
ncbi:MAG: aldehyde ferredoxin oxidoreductase [Deltaproteobacteria bacterium]|nr:aldehyde ferredoxin oxidoreductase [Deltaproteobacteria bacterium]